MATAQTPEYAFLSNIFWGALNNWQSDFAWSSPRKIEVTHRRQQQHRLFSNSIYHTQILRPSLTC